MIETIQMAAIELVHGAAGFLGSFMGGLPCETIGIMAAFLALALLLVATEP